MSNGNRLSISDLEDQIAGLQAKLRLQQQRQPALSWYTCTRCSALYTSPWGCGCPRPGESPECFPLLDPTVPEGGSRYPDKGCYRVGCSIHGGPGSGAKEDQRG